MHGGREGNAKLSLPLRGLSAEGGALGSVFLLVFNGLVEFFFYETPSSQPKLNTHLEKG